MTQPSLFKGTLICAVEGCEEPVLILKHGLCRNHYAVARRANMPPCSVDGCTNPQTSKGYCMSHYQRLRYGGALDAPFSSFNHRWQKADGICSADGCDNVAPRGRAYCSTECRPPPARPSLKRNEHGEKRCSRCKEWRPESDFGPGKAADGLNSQCRPCHSEVVRSRKHGGIGPRGRARLLKEQGGRCAICGTDDPGTRWGWCIDHDHACCDGPDSCGKCIRGVLCVNCNSGLGSFADDTDRMRAAIEYLRRARLRVAV